MVPSLEAETPLSAVGLPVVVSGGHAVAHAPKHVLLEPLSFSKRYSVRPLPSASTLPSLVFVSSTFAAERDTEGAGE